MAFLIDAQELKPGLVLFRRGDVKHRNWYCRIKLPEADRYKTVSLKTADVTTAKERAFDEDADLRFRIKHDVPVFNRPFSQVAKDYVDLQKERVEAGEITQHRCDVVESIIRAQLNPYVGSTQITLVGQDRWAAYPLWRRKNGVGRNGRVSDATVRYEMSILRSIMAYAVVKRLVPESHRFGGKLPLAKVRRDEFTPEEYRKLHTFARGWVKKAPTGMFTWYRTVAYNFVLIMCNTGMRPPEAKNLRWRDVAVRTDDQGPGSWCWRCGARTRPATWWPRPTWPTISNASAPSARRPSRTIRCSPPGKARRLSPSTLAKSTTCSPPQG